MNTFMQIEQASVEAQNTMTYEEGYALAEAYASMEKLSKEAKTFNAIKAMDLPDDAALEAASIALGCSVDDVKKMKDNSSNESFTLFVLGFAGGLVLGSLAKSVLRIFRKVKGYFKKKSLPAALSSAQANIGNLSDEQADKLLASYPGLCVMAENKISTNLMWEPLSSDLKGYYKLYIDAIGAGKDWQKYTDAIKKYVQKFDVKIGSDKEMFIEYKRKGVVTKNNETGKATTRTANKLSGVSGLKSLVDYLAKDGLDADVATAALDSSGSFTKQVMNEYKVVAEAYDKEIHNDGVKEKFFNDFYKSVSVIDHNLGSLITSNVTDAYHYFTDKHALLSSIK